MIARKLTLAVLMVALSTLGPQRASAAEKGGGAGWTQGCYDCQKNAPTTIPAGVALNRLA